MKQYYAYNACSSEIISRAGSLEDLLKKLYKPNEDYGLIYRLGLNKKEPWYFYVKSDIHGNDYESTSIPIENVQEVARKIGILPV